MADGRWTRETCIDALRRWATLHPGMRPTCNAWVPAPAGCPSRDTLRTLFGSWRLAMVAAGFGDRGRGDYPRSHREGQPCSNCGERQGRYGARGRCRRCAYVWRRYGHEWDGVTERERIDARRREASLQALRDLVVRLGRLPTWAEYRELKPDGATAAVDRSWGSWSGFVRAAGFVPRKWTRRS